MKTLKAICVAVALAFVSLPTAAQENLKAAYREFVNGGGTASSTFLENDEATGRPISYYYRHSFTLPASDRKRLDAVLDAFRKDMGRAYVVYVRGQRENGGCRRGESPRPLVSLSYGSALDKRVDYGMHADRNYEVMLVRDGRDSLFRYAYAVVWYVDSAANTLCGMIDEMYGRDPQRAVGKAYGIGEMGDYKIFNGDWRGLKWSKKAAKAMRDMKRRDSLESVISSSADFLIRFGNLRASYMESVRNGGVECAMLNNGLVNLMVELCREHSAMLTEDEREVCANSLKEMQEATTDSYLHQLIGVGIKSLKP